MTGKDGHVVAEREYFLFDAFEQKIGISAGQIPATDAAGEEHVAADEQFVFAREEAKAAGTVPRHFKHFHFQAEKFSPWRLLNQKIRLHRLELQFKTEAAKKLGIGNHRRSLRVTTDLAIEVSLDFCHIRDVIEVPMREKQKLYIDMARFEPIAGAIGRVEQNPALRSLNKIAIGFENAAAERFVGQHAEL